MKIISFLRGLLALICAPFLTLLTSLTAMFCLLVLRWTPRRVMALPRMWGRIILGLSGVSVRLIEEAPLALGQPYIFAANHQSQFDIFAMHGYFDADFRWLAKKELFRVPIFGRAMEMAGHIAVDRAQGRDALKSLVLAAKRIADGTSVVIFPEGTRSPDGKLHSFKSGVMFLAIKSGVPMVPVAISGTYNVLPKGKLLAKPGKVVIRMGKPIETKGLKSDQKKELALSLQQAVAELLERNDSESSAAL